MEEKNKTTIWIIVGLVILAVLGYFVYQSLKSPAEEPSTFVSNFKECALAGFPVSEGDPRECRTTNGSIYKEETTTPPGNDTNINTNTDTNTDFNIDQLSK